jgi:hypothetical protein
LEHGRENWQGGSQDTIGAVDSQKSRATPLEYPVMVLEVILAVDCVAEAIAGRDAAVVVVVAAKLDEREVAGVTEVSFAAKLNRGIVLEVSGEVIGAIEVPEELRYELATMLNSGGAKEELVRIRLQSDGSADKSGKPTVSVVGMLVVKLGFGCGTDEVVVDDAVDATVGGGVLRLDALGIAVITVTVTAGGHEVGTVTVCCRGLNCSVSSNRFRNSCSTVWATFISFEVITVVMYAVLVTI